LRVLSNDDKHNFVVQLFREYDFRVHVSDETVSVDPDDETRVRIAVEAPEARFCAPDGSPLVPALTEMARGAARLLLDLQGDFGEVDTVDFR
jgi:hypothetical protein